MHELAVCQEMLRQVEQIAINRAAIAVDSIRVQIGPLSGVEARLLRQAFPLAAAGTLAEHARLDIELLPLRVHCRQCGADTDASPNRLICGKCGDYHTQLLSGDELLLASLELTTENRETSNV